MHTSIDGTYAFSRFTLLTLAGLAFHSPLAAQEPVRADGEQVADEQATSDPAEKPAGDRFINPTAREGQTDSPFYGLIIEKGAESTVMVTDVKFGSDPWEAGIRPGDQLVAFADASAKDLEYDEFLEAIDAVLDRTNDSDKITVTLMRDGEPFRTLMNGFGPSVDELRERRDESQEDREEVLQDAAESRRDREEELRQVETEKLDELTKLYEASMSGDSMSSSDRRRMRDLESSVFLPTAYGGVGYGGIGVAGGGVSSQAAGQRNRSSASAGMKGSRFSQLRSELTSLREQAAGGALSTEQSQRLNSLEQLSQAVGGRLQQSASNAQFSPQMQAQYEQLQSASRSGDISPQQRRQLNQFQQRERMIRSSANSNANLPFGGRGAAGSGNANLTARQNQAAASGPNGATATQNGSGIGNAGPIGGSGAGIGTAGAGAGVGTAGSGVGNGASAGAGANAGAGAGSR